MKRQYRIYVTGKFQCSVSSAETPEVIAARAIETMKLSGVKPVITLGQINFVPV